MSSTEARVADARDRFGLPEERARAAVNNVQRERLLSQDINIGGALTLAADMPDTSYVMSPILVDAQLITITAHNGHGKSTFIAAVAFSLALNRALGVMHPRRQGFIYIV